MESVLRVDSLYVFLSIHTFVKNDREFGPGIGKVLHSGEHIVHYPPEHLGVVAIALILAVEERKATVS